MQIAYPSKFSKRKLARLYEHEVAHTKGLEHEQMSEETYWSKGGEPKWARDVKLRYKGPAKPFKA